MYYLLLLQFKSLLPVKPIILHLLTYRNMHNLSWLQYYSQQLFSNTVNLYPTLNVTDIRIAQVRIVHDARAESGEPQFYTTLTIPCFLGRQRDYDIRHDILW